MNAVVASGVSAKAYCAQVDTVWIDLSKGLAVRSEASSPDRQRLFKRRGNGNNGWVDPCVSQASLLLPVYTLLNTM